MKALSEQVCVWCVCFTVGMHVHSGVIERIMHEFNKLVALCCTICLALFEGAGV